MVDSGSRRHRGKPRWSAAAPRRALHATRARMRGIDHQIDALGVEKLRQSLGAAEPASTHNHTLLLQSRVQSLGLGVGAEPCQ